MSTPDPLLAPELDVATPRHARRERGRLRFEHAQSFLDAVVSLSLARPTSEEALSWSRRAGADLVELGLLDASSALGEALRPDPESGQTMWTVACYEIGDLIPCELRDFKDAADAVLALVHCEQEGHVAAELIASTEAGIRWSALVRAGDEVRFQLAGPDSVSSSSSAEPDALERAFANWANRLRRWTDEDDDAPLGEQADTAEPLEVEAAERTPRLLALLTDLTAGVARIEAALASIAARLDGIDERLSRVERSAVDKTGERSDNS